jgi:hypothetical protein
MSNDLEEERQGIISWLLDALFGRREASKDDIERSIHRIGTINRRLKSD